MVGSERTFRILWGTLLVLLTAASLLPGFVVDRFGIPTAAVGDKLLHFAGYSLLAFLPALWFSSWRRRLAYAAVVITLGIILELTQRIVPGRNFELADLGANNLGVIVGTFVGCFLRIAGRL